MHKCRIRLLSNRASVSLELCNTSVSRGFHILCSFLGCTTPFIYPCVRFRVPSILLLVYLFHLRICESLSTLLTLANILHQIFVPLSSPSSTISLTCVGVRNRQELVPIVLFPCYIIERSLIHLQHRSRYIWYSSSPFSTHICSSIVMDRQGISSPVFDNKDGANNDITKMSIFGLQHEMQGAQSTLRERLDNLAIDIRHSEARKRDYIDKKLAAHKEEQDARMVEIRTLLKSTSPSSSSRRRHSSHKSSKRKNDASASRPRPHLHGDHHHVCDPPRQEGQVTSKQHVHGDDERHLLRPQVRQRQHHHDDAHQAQMHKSQQALLHAKSKLHEHKRRPRDDHYQDGATAT